MKKILNSIACGVIGMTLAAGVAAAPIGEETPSNMIANDQYPDLVENLMRQGKFEQAQQRLKEGLQKNPLSAQLKFMNCVLLEQTGKTDEAISALEEFSKIYPEIPEAYNNLAALYSARGEWTRAERLLKRAIQLRPKYAQAWENLGSLYVSQANASWKRALQYAPKNEALRDRSERLEAFLK